MEVSPDFEVPLSAKWIADNSTDVSIDMNEVEKCAKMLCTKVDEGAFSLENWKLNNKLHPNEMNEETLNWIFLVDTLNFSFWHDDPSVPFTVKYKDTSYTGYWSLCAAVNRALDEGIPITSPDYQASVTLDSLRYIFRSETSTEVPLLDKRMEVLHEAGIIVKERFKGSFLNCIKEANRSAKTLVKLVTANFTSYKDEAIFNDKQVQLYKRAQILVADIWACFEANSYGEFTDIDIITMFADYRVPQALAFLGILKYSELLSKKMLEHIILESGSRLEVEIRGCSIWAVEILIQKIKELLIKQSTTDVFINAIVVDFYLWDYAKSHSEEMKKIPIHSTRSVFY